MNRELRLPLAVFQTAIDRVTSVLSPVHAYKRLLCRSQFNAVCRHMYAFSTEMVKHWIVEKLDTLPAPYSGHIDDQYLKETVAALERVFLRLDDFFEAMFEKSNGFDVKDMVGALKWVVTRTKYSARMWNIAGNWISLTRKDDVTPWVVDRANRHMKAVEAQLQMIDDKFSVKRRRLVL